MLRELELLIEGEAAPAANRYEEMTTFKRQRMAQSAGRLDALLVPFSPWDAPWTSRIGGWCWQAARLVGIEVKRDRADFKNGLNKGQFERYWNGLAALYIATPHHLVKTSEIPSQFGHLVIYEGGSDCRQSRHRCVCKRHAKFEDKHPAPEMLWKLLHAITRDCEIRQRELRARWEKAREKIGRKAGAMISAALSAGGVEAYSG
jgi:hypothetical protein